MIDETDATILDLLQENARISQADVARVVGLAPSAVSSPSLAARPAAFVQLLKATNTRKGDFAQQLAERIVAGGLPGITVGVCAVVPT